MLQHRLRDIFSGRFESNRGAPSFCRALRLDVPYRLQLARLPLMVSVFTASVLCSPVHSQPPTQKSPAPQIQPSGCGSVDRSPKNPSCLRLSFQGEVSAGKSFALEFGEDLAFRLNPEAALGGWFIEVIPKTAGADADTDYVWVVTPPYHFGNQRYLDTSYGVSPRESVQNSPREFNFVLNDQQYKKAARLVDLAISSHPSSETKSQEQLEREGEEATTALLKLPVATGKLWILESRVKDSTGGADSGSIEWIKFKVELRVPCGFAVPVGTRQIAVDFSACGEQQGAKVN